MITDNTTDSMAMDDKVYNVQFGDYMRTLLRTYVNIREDNIDVLLAPESLEIFKKAFTTKSFSQTENQEIFEFMGDGILKGLINTFIVYKFPEIMDEQRLSLISQNLEKKKTLSNYARMAGFDQYIRIDENLKQQMQAIGEEPGKRRTVGTWASVLEDTFEAFIAALFIACNRAKFGTGYIACTAFVNYFLEREQISTDVATLKSFVTRLKEDVFDYQRWPFDQNKIYVELPLREGERGFRVGVSIPGQGIVAESLGNTKTNAKEIASNYALQVLKQRGLVRPTQGPVDTGRQQGSRFQMSAAVPSFVPRQ